MGSFLYFLYFTSCFVCTSRILWWRKRKVWKKKFSCGNVEIGRKWYLREGVNCVKQWSFWSFRGLLVMSSASFPRHWKSPIIFPPTTKQTQWKEEKNLSLDIDTVTKECIMLIQREINYTRTQIEWKVEMRKKNNFPMKSRGENGISIFFCVNLSRTLLCNFVFTLMMITITPYIFTFSQKNYDLFFVVSSAKLFVCLNNFFFFSFSSIFA